MNKSTQSQVIGYLRVSTEKQNLANQKLAILQYANQHNLSITRFIDVTISSRRAIAERKILTTLALLNPGDTLITSELSRLGRSTIEVLTLTKQIIDQGIKVIAIKENLVLDKNNNRDPFTKVMLAFFTILAELERDLISQRTIEGLAVRKAQGIILGKPKGTLQKSMYDPHKATIAKLLNKQVTPANIIKIIGVGKTRSLFHYIVSRQLKNNHD